MVEMLATQEEGEGSEKEENEREAQQDMPGEGVVADRLDVRDEERDIEKWGY